MAFHLDFYTAYDEFEHQTESRIDYLMIKYGWSKLEAQHYFYHAPYDESDWIEYD